MERDPDAALSGWVVSRFDASNRVTQILSRAPLPVAPLHAWATETLAWASSASDAIATASALFAEAPPPAPEDVASALRATAEASLSLFDLHNSFVGALRGAATDIADGRATEINETAAKSIEHLPWLLLESQRLKLLAGGLALSANDLTRWLLLARAHAYAVRRDLEDLERQAELGSWLEADAKALLDELAAMQDAIIQGRGLVDAKLADPAALAEHPSAGDLLRSCGQSFKTLSTLAQAWSDIFAHAAPHANAGDQLAAIEDACAEFSGAEAELDRQLARRAEIMRAIR